MLRERLLGVFLLAVAGLGLCGYLRPVSVDPSENSTSAKNWFFINKAHQDRSHAMIVIGDSRALRAISPEVINEELPGADCFNFAFHAGGMNKEIYTAAQEILDMAAARPVVIMAPTALAFMSFKQNNDQYHQYLVKPRDEVWVYRKAPGFATWFQPIPPALPLRLAFGETPGRILHEEFTELGWIATDQDPLSDITDLGVHTERLTGHEMDQELVQNFMTQTKLWSEQGVLVVGLFPPAYAPRVALEDSALGLDRELFIRSFEAAGGHWVALDGGSYDTYDGSHLVSESARNYSRDLAREIKSIY